MYSSLLFPHELVPVREIPEDKIRIILERYFFVWSRLLTKDWYLAPFFVSPCARASEASFRGDRALGFLPCGESPGHPAISPFQGVLGLEILILTLDVFLTSRDPLVTLF